MPDAEQQDAIQQALYAVDSAHQFHGEDCICGFSSAVARTRTEHITTAVAELLSGLAVQYLSPNGTSLTRCCCDRTTARLIICPVHPKAHLSSSPGNSDGSAS